MSAKNGEIMEERYYEVARYNEGWATVKIKAECEEDALLLAEALEQDAWTFNDSYCYEVIEGALTNAF